MAALVGAKQPSIARLESGKLTPSLGFLRRVVTALGGKLTITIEAGEDAAAHQSAEAQGQRAGNARA